MAARVCQHDPRKDNCSVSPIEESASYMIMYCTVCKRTEIYRGPAVGSGRAGYSGRASPDTPQSGGRSSGGYSSSPNLKGSSPSPPYGGNDSDDEGDDARSTIDKVWADIAAARNKPRPSSSANLKPSSGAVAKPRSSNYPVIVPKASDAKKPPAAPSSAKPSSPLSNNKAKEGPAKDSNPMRANSPAPLPRIPHIGSLEDSERVVLMKYIVSTGKWANSDARLVIASVAFQEGNLRAAYHCVDVTIPNQPKHFVCKQSKDPKEDVKTYYVDVEMQCQAQKIAEEYNKRNPPKKVYFVDAFLIKCKDRKGEPIMAVEPYLHGKYVKHTNNYGYVSKEDRNTPQAFSHFSYCYSQGQMLICDIQGVDDYYTDPQIHSRDGKGWGHGNLGSQGMLKFFETHHCNNICSFMRLPPNKPKAVDHGTMAPPKAKKEAKA